MVKGVGSYRVLGISTVLPLPVCDSNGPPLYIQFDYIMNSNGSCDEVPIMTML